MEEKLHVQVVRGVKLQRNRGLYFVIVISRVFGVENGKTWVCAGILTSLQRMKKVKDWGNVLSRTTYTNCKWKKKKTEVKRQVVLFDLVGIIAEHDDDEHVWFFWRPKCTG